MIPINIAALTTKSQALKGLVRLQQAAQVVTATVLTADSEARRLRLSLALI